MRIRNGSEPGAQLLARSLPHLSDGNEPAAIRYFCHHLKLQRAVPRAVIRCDRNPRQHGGRAIATGATGAKRDSILCDGLRSGWAGKRLDCAGLVLFDIEDCRQPCHLQQVMHPLAQIHELEFATLVANGGMSLY